MTNKKKDYEEIISKELDEMLKQHPELKKKPLYKLAGVLDDMTGYLGRIKSEEKLLEPQEKDDPTLDEMTAHFPLKLAAKKIAQYQKELKEILFELTGAKPH